MLKYVLTFIITLSLGLFYFIYYPNVNISKLEYKGEDKCIAEFNFPFMQDLKNEKIIKNDYFIKNCNYKPSDLIDDLKAYSEESHYLINKDKSLPYKSVYYFYLKNFSTQQLNFIINSHVSFSKDINFISTSSINFISEFKLQENLNIKNKEVVLLVRLKNNADLEFSYFYANKNDFNLYLKKYQPYLKKNVYKF